MFNFPFSLALPLASYNSQTSLSAAQSLIIANSITATKSSANANHKTSQLVTTIRTTVVFPFSASTAGPRCALPN